jgi:predicted Rdx family selenoprotein
MQDHISKLCGKLVLARHQNQIKPEAAELRQAIRDHVEAVREDVAKIAFVDRIVEVDVLALEAQRSQREIRA